MKFNSVMNMQVPQDGKIHNNLLNYFIVILVLGATFFSFLYLDTKSFWLDEAYSISFVNLSWSQLWEIISRREANMSLYYVLLKIWVEMFGDSEFVARSLSVIFAVGGVIMTYAIGAHLFNIRTGLTAGLVLTVNAFFIKYAQEARCYTLLLLLTTFSMYLFIKVIERQQYKYYIALGLTNALVLYAHFFGFFVLIAQVISLVVPTVQNNPMEENAYICPSDGILSRATRCLYPDSGISSAWLDSKTFVTSLLFTVYKIRR